MTAPSGPMSCTQGGSRGRAARVLSHVACMHCIPYSSSDYHQNRAGTKPCRGPDVVGVGQLPLAQHFTADHDLPKHGGHEAFGKGVCLAWYTPPSMPVRAIFLKKVRTSRRVLVPSGLHA